MPKKLTTSEFIDKAIIIHGLVYDYSKVVYTTNKNKVIIICNQHGEFIQTASHHLSGSICPTCAKIKVAKQLLLQNRSNIFEFTAKAFMIHGNKYTYEKAKYVNSKTKITITCPIHGDFEQTPNDHLDGCGCPICKFANTKTFWSYSDWQKAGESSANFNGFTLYVIECKNNSEHFIKIGKTFQSLNVRFQKGVKMPYNWTTLLTYTSDAITISKLECKLQNNFKNFAYIPTIPFGGSYECFEPTILTSLKEKFELYN